MNTEEVQTVILLGGQGTRIATLFPDRPKALVPVAGKPILQWQIEWLLNAGLTHIHLAAGHMATALTDWIASNPVPGVEITIAVEEEPKGTGGALKWNAPHITSSPFLTVNGDSLAPDLDFQQMIEAHTKHDEADITMAVARIQKADRYGTVEYDETGRILAFQEKEQRENGWINAGVYLVNSSVLEDMDGSQSVSLETEVFPRLAASGHLFAHVAPGPLLDMGTEDGLKNMEEYLKR